MKNETSAKTTIAVKPSAIFKKSSSRYCNIVTILSFLRGFFNPVEKSGLALLEQNKDVNN